MDIYTIGHSNHRWESFASLLKPRGIQTLVDVRTNPASRRAPFANRRSLPSLLEREGICYVYMGDSLGGKPDDPMCYDGKGRPDYGRMASTTQFKDGIVELVRVANDSTVAIMCAEEDPAKCHRNLLIGPALGEHGATLSHIRKGGSVQD